MTVFLATLNQMGILFSMILVGYIAAKCRVVPENAAGILSKLENTVFVPALLIPVDDGAGINSRLKNFCNPMFAGMVIGMGLGLLNAPVPAFARSVLTTLGDCMSPIAMLLTGMTIARIDLKSTLTNALLYAVSLIRLLAIPLLAIAVLRILKLSYGIEACIVCNLAMPLGLSTVVIPASYGKDTSTAAGMALLSHLLSCATIPLIFMLFEMPAV